MLTSAFVPARPSRRKRALAVAAILLQGLLGSSIALAQDDPAATERARAVFSEGVRLAQEQQFESAEAQFREALTLRDAPTIRYNLASVLFEQQEFTEANELVRALLASTETPDAVRTPTAALAAQIQGASGLVLFQIPAALADGVLAVDDLPVADPTRAVALGPGHHHAVVTRNGAEIGASDVDAVAGERTVAEVTASHGAGAARDVTDEWWFWTSIAGGVVLVGVVVGVSVGVATSQAEPPVQGNFMPGVITWP